MAAGQRKVRIMTVEIARTNPVTYTANWRVFVENVVGEDVHWRNGQTSGSFGTPAAFNAMTGAQMRAQVDADVAADTNVPPRDVLS